MLTASAWATGCEPGDSSKSVSQQVSGLSDSGQTGQLGLDTPLKITADFPAFYAADGAVVVSGAIEDGTLGELEVLTIDGTDATLLDGRRFEGTASLADGEPWRVVELFVRDDNGREGRIHVQVGRAAAPDSPTRTDALGVMAGPEALDELVRHVSTFIRPSELAPPEGAILRRTCEPVNEPDVESGDITEELRLTGTATLRTVAGDVDTDDEALHVTLPGTELAWGAEVVTFVEGEVITRPAELILQLQRGDDLPHTPCDAPWVAVTRAPEPVVWGAEFAWPPSCFDAESAGLAAEPLYAGVVPPELDRASCAWADWLDGALATELTGIDTERAVTVDRAGLALALQSTPADEPPVQVVDSGVVLGGDTLTGTVSASVVGPVIHAAAALSRTELGTDSLDGIEISWSRTPPVPEVTTIAAVDAGDLAVLPSPVGFRIEVGAGACSSEGHVIPAPTPLVVDDPADGTRLSVSPTPAGADVVNSCGLSDDQWRAVWTTVLASAYDGQVGSWRPTDGLQRLGGRADTTVDADRVSADVDIPAP